MNAADVRTALAANLSLRATLQRLGMDFAEDYSAWQWIFEVVDPATREVIAAGTENHLWQWIRSAAEEK